MNIKIDVTLTDIKGELIKTLEKKENSKFESTEKTPNELPFITSKVEMTLRDCCVNALLAPGKDDAQVSGTTKLRLFKMAERISGSTEVNLNAEEITLIKEKVNILYPTLIVGRIFGLLEKE